MSVVALQGQKQDLNALCKEAEEQAQPIYFTYKDKRFVLVTVDDFQYFEDLEDTHLSHPADEALKDPGEWITLDELNTRLEL